MGLTTQLCLNKLSSQLPAPRPSLPNISPQQRLENEIHGPYKARLNQTGTASRSPFAISTTQAFSPWILAPPQLLLLLLKEETKL